MNKKFQGKKYSKNCFIKILILELNDLKLKKNILIFDLHGFSSVILRIRHNHTQQLHFIVQRL